MLDERDKKAMLLGLGLDCDDGHVRVTRAENFQLVGGSHETHQGMQEKCIKFNEKLDTRGKRIEDLERQEFIDLAAECRMPVVLPGSKRDKNDREGRKKI